MLFQNDWRSVQPRVVFLWRDCKVYSEETKIYFLQGTTLFPVNQCKKILRTLIPERISIDWIFLWNVKFLMIVLFLSVHWLFFENRATLEIQYLWEEGQFQLFSYNASFVWKFSWFSENSFFFQKLFEAHLSVTCFRAWLLFILKLLLKIRNGEGF